MVWQCCRENNLQWIRWHVIRSVLLPCKIHIVISSCAGYVFQTIISVPFKHGRCAVPCAYVFRTATATKSRQGGPERLNSLLQQFNLTKCPFIMWAVGLQHMSQLNADDVADLMRYKRCGAVITRCSCTISRQDIQKIRTENFESSKLIIYHSFLRINWNPYLRIGSCSSWSITIVASRVVQWRNWDTLSLGNMNTGFWRLPEPSENKIWPRFQ